MFGPIDITAGHDTREGFLEERASRPLKEDSPAEGNLEGSSGSPGVTGQDVASLGGQTSLDPLQALSGSTAWPPGEPAIGGRSAEAVGGGHSDLAQGRD